MLKNQRNKNFVILVI